MDMLNESTLLILFEKAAEYVRSVAGNLSSDDLLYLYGRFKQAKEGPCHTQKPGFFDFQGKQKWEAWKKLGSKSKGDAMQEYVSYLSDIKPEWENQIETGEVKKSSAFGVSVSTLSHTEDDIPDDKKSIFDWCKEGNIKMVSKCLTTDKCDVNTKDEEGLSLLHWASDRGYEDMVSALVKLHANINEIDGEGQTALHYAASCEHVGVIKTLISNGADLSIQDVDGLTPEAVTDNQEIKLLLLPPT